MPGSTLDYVERLRCRVLELAAVVQTEAEYFRSQGRAFAGRTAELEAEHRRLCEDAERLQRIAAEMVRRSRRLRCLRAHQRPGQN
jgi:hypothetical protein